MPDRHFELPAHPGLEYYRKQAEHLQRTYAAGDAATQARVADVLGDRAAGRFLLSDASIRDELFHADADADGWLHILFATRWHDPVTQQIHDLIESRSRQA